MNPNVSDALLRSCSVSGMLRSQCMGDGATETAKRYAVLAMPRINQAYIGMQHSMWLYHRYDVSAFYSREHTHSASRSTISSRTS